MGGKSPLANAVPTENLARRVFKNRSEHALNPDVGREVAEGFRSFPVFSSLKRLWQRVKQIILGTSIPIPKCCHGVKWNSNFTTRTGCTWPEAKI